MNAPLRQGQRRRVAFLNSHPIQYFTPLYAYINRSPDIEAVPIFMSDFSLRGAVDPGFRPSLKWDIDLLAVSTRLTARRRPPRILRTAHVSAGAPGVEGGPRGSMTPGRCPPLLGYGQHLGLLAATSVRIPPSTASDPSRLAARSNRPAQARAGASSRCSGHALGGG